MTRFDSVVCIWNNYLYAMIRGELKKFRIAHLDNDEIVKLNHKFANHVGLDLEKEWANGK